MSKHRVLIVDDTAANIHLLAEILSNSYEILIATSGKDAIQIAQTQEVSLILLDIMMPEMDGYEVCKKLKESALTSSIPIIFVTALNSTQAEVKGLNAGAVDFITKPFNDIIIQARVRTHIKLHEQNILLEKLAKTDGLTGIANRREYDERIVIESARARRDKMPLALIMLDIDFFKQYNDSYGHGLGDECLRRVAQTIKEIPKRPSDLFARYGGEEFVVLLPGVSKEDAKLIADEIRESIEQLKIEHKSSSISPYLSVSLGVASLYPDNVSSSINLEKAADEALYRAKESGRNRVNF